MDGNVYVENTADKGRGVFALRPFKQGELIDKSYCIWFPRQQYVDQLKYTELEHYLFTTKRGNSMLALNHGSLFNHCDPPNVSYTVDEDARVISYHAIRDISQGEELTIFYGHNLWFKDANDDSSVQSSSDSEDVDCLNKLELFD